MIRSEGGIRLCFTDSHVVQDSYSLSYFFAWLQWLC